MMTGTLPPSTDHAAPATLDARSEHRKTITAAGHVRAGWPLARGGADVHDPPEPIQARLHHPLAGVSVGHIQRQRFATAPRHRARRRELPQSLQAAPDEHHAGAFARQRHRRRLPDPTRGPGHDAGAAEQPEIHTR
jgi:hypothetical protein